MKIGRKLLVSFTIILIFLLVSSVLTGLYTLRINNRLLRITEVVNPAENDIKDMVSILWKANYIVQRYSTENDNEILNALEAEFQYINALFDEKEKSILTTIDNNIIENNVAQAANKHENFYRFSQKLIDKRKQESAKGVTYNYDDSSFLVQYSIAKQLELDVVDAVDSLQAGLDELSSITQKANDESSSAVQSAIIIIFLTSILGIVTAAIIWSYLTKSITKPIKNLSAATSKLSKGNFNVDLKVEDADDEISELTITFKQMINSLRKIVEESPRLKKFIKIKGRKEAALSQKYVVESGTSYLIKDQDSSEAYDIFLTKLNQEHAPLLIARDNPKTIEQRFGITKKNLIWLSDEKEKGVTSSSNLNSIQKSAVEFMTKNKKSIILLDRSDYILNRYGFEAFLRFITNINDKIMTKESILLLPIDPQIFNNKQLSLLEKELHSPPQQSIDFSLSDELKLILKFISDRKAINKLATFKDIGAKFSITAPTTQKKIKELQTLGLITISKRGRNKHLIPTRDGERILAN
jgi:HAMP domain-containing protein